MFSRLFRFPARGRISSSPALFDLDGDGREEIVIGGPKMLVLTGEGRVLHGWPRRGGRPFASSPAIADIDDDGHAEVVAGCDDGKVYAWDSAGKALRGWPVTTGKDVFSTPAIADVDSDGHLEVVVGSDDGRLYVLRHDGVPIDGFPVATGGFISSSPAVGDIDGDGKAEIVVGSWDGKIHAWRSDGTPVAGWPVQIGHIVWSSPLLVDLFGDGKLEVLVGSDRLYIFSSSGRLISSGSAGGGYCVSSPAVGGRGGDPIVVSAAMSVAMSRIGGGWTRPLRQVAEGSGGNGLKAVGCYAWSSPLLVDVDGNGRTEIAIASWDGCIHLLRHTGAEIRDVGMVTSGPLFSTPAMGDIDGDDHIEVAIGSWDGYVYLWRLAITGSRVDWPMFRGGPSRTGRVERRFTNGGLLSLTESPAHPLPPDVMDIRTVPTVPYHRVPTFVIVKGNELTSALKAMMLYKISGEGEDHSVPMVCSGDSLVGIIQPLGALRLVSFHVEFDEPDNRHVRIPAAGEWTIKVAPPLLRHFQRGAKYRIDISGIS